MNMKKKIWERSKKKKLHDATRLYQMDQSSKGRNFTLKRRKFNLKLKMKNVFPL